MLIARLTVVGLSFLLLGGAAQAPQEQRFVVLPSHSVPTISARVMDDVDSHGSWEPATADIEGLERSLSRVSELKVTGWTSKTRIEHPERYFRQYIGVSHRNQRASHKCVSRCTPPSDWRSHLYVVVDGATCYWQALYDPSTKSFSNHAINVAPEKP